MMLTKHIYLTFMLIKSVYPLDVSTKTVSQMSSAGTEMSPNGAPTWTLDKSALNYLTVTLGSLT